MIVQCTGVSVRKLMIITVYITWKMNAKIHVDKAKLLFRPKYMCEESCHLLQSESVVNNRTPTYH